MHICYLTVSVSLICHGCHKTKINVGKASPLLEAMGIIQFQTYSGRILLHVVLGLRSPFLCWLSARDLHSQVGHIFPCVSLCFPSSNNESNLSQTSNFFSFSFFHLSLLLLGPSTSAFEGSCDYIEHPWMNKNNLSILRPADEQP